MLSTPAPWNSLLLGDSVPCLNIGLNDFSRLLKPKLMSKPRNTLKSPSNELLSYCSLLWRLRDANNEIAEGVVHHPLARCVSYEVQSPFHCSSTSELLLTWNLRICEWLLQSSWMSLDMESEVMWSHVSARSPGRINRKWIPCPRASKWV